MSVINRALENISGCLGMGSIGILDTYGNRELVQVCQLAVLMLECESNV